MGRLYFFNEKSFCWSQRLVVGGGGGENKTQEEEKIERVTEMGCDNVSSGLVGLHR